MISFFFKPNTAYDMRISDWSSYVCSSDLASSNARSDLQKETSEQQELITMQLRRAAIVSPLRTPVGKFGGGLSSLTAGELGATILKSLVERSGIDPERVDDVVFGHGYPSGEAPSIGRWSWLAAGLPPTVPGFQLDRLRGSGLQAIIEAALMVQTGPDDVVVAHIGRAHV